MPENVLTEMHAPTTPLEKLQAALEDITAEQRISHDQATWMSWQGGLKRPAGHHGALVPVNCGTACCLAGAGIAYSDYVFVAYPGADEADEVVHKSNLEALANDEETETFYAETIGREIFGLTATEADRLFSGGNTLFELWAMAYALKDGQIKLPSHLGQTKDAQGYIKQQEVRDLPFAVKRWLDEDAGHDWIVDNYWERLAAREPENEHAAAMAAKGQI